jgi:hypothetical protein
MLKCPTCHCALPEAIDQPLQGNDLNNGQPLPEPPTIPDSSSTKEWECPFTD